MQTSEFELFVTDLCEYLEHKPPRSETMRAWFADCQKIPGECLPWIRAQFKNLDRFPQNFCKWLIHQFRLWLEEHPEKKAKEDKRGCDKCHSGWIMVSKFFKSHARRYDVLFRCAHCNGGSGAIPAKTAYQLLEAEYCKPINSTIHPYHAAFNDPPNDEVAIRIWEGNAVAYSVDGMPLPICDVVEEMQESGDIPF